MARDYAQRSNNTRRQTRGKKTSSNGLPGWVWMIVGLSFGLAVAAFVYIRRPVATPLVQSPAASLPQATSAAPSDDPRRKNGKAEPLALPPKEKQRFTFYDALKQQEVALPADAAKSAAPPTSASDGDAGAVSYVIQVAAFRSHDEADKQKASLALLGVESRIESVTVDGSDTFYRVRIGPDKNWAHVQSTMVRLEANGIQAQLLKLN